MRLLRVNVVTGSPLLVRSLAPTLPTPCGYLRLKWVQFLYTLGTATAAPAIPLANVHAIIATEASARTVRYVTVQPLCATGLIGVVALLEPRTTPSCSLRCQCC